MLAHEGKKDEEIASATKSHFMTVQKVRERFNKEGLAGVLKEKKRSGRPEKLQGKEKAHLIAVKRHQEVTPFRHLKVSPS